MGKEYTRFSAAMRQTDRLDSDGILHKQSKKLKKLSSVGKIDQSMCSKRVKLPKKFFIDCHMVNLATVPRKVRSAMKRHCDFVSPSLPNPKDGLITFQTPLKDHNKKLEVNKEDERQQSTMTESYSEQITKDEEEAIAGLLLLAGYNNTDEINLKTDTSDSEDLVKNDMVMEDLNKSTNTVDVKKDCKDFRNRNESVKRCSRHVYICRMIKHMQVTEDKMVNSHKEPKTDTIKESFTKEATIANNMVFQDQWNDCSVVQDYTESLAGTSEQVPLPAYFGSPLYDPSQWLRPPKHQMWKNPIMAGARCQNWQKSGQKTMPRHSGLLNVLGSKENGGLFLVDSSPALNLTCNEHLGSDRSWLNDL